mgnify:CR=1 FL=1
MNELQRGLFCYLLSGKHLGGNEPKKVTSLVCFVELAYLASQYDQDCH